MRLGVLGPLIVAEGDVSYVPRPPKQRQLLALLIMHANEPVPMQTCVRELWDDNPPLTAVQTVQTYVMQLRRQGPAGRLITRDSGYQFQVGQAELDVDTFTALVESAHDAAMTGDHDAASAALSSALALWRGPALADVRTGPVLRARLAGITENQLSALEQRIEADLRLGRHEQLVNELRALGGQNPLNENLHAQSMLALYRSGRHDEAADVYEVLARTLADEQGLTPSPRIQRLHRAILDCDVLLDPATSSDRR
jgi:SARP family transcriptional regulator, regulator of embCAB operon